MLIAPSPRALILLSLNAAGIPTRSAIPTPSAVMMRLLRKELPKSDRDHTVAKTSNRGSRKSSGGRRSPWTGERVARRASHRIGKTLTPIATTAMVQTPTREGRESLPSIADPPLEGGESHDAEHHDDEEDDHESHRLAHAHRLEAGEVGRDLQGLRRALRAAAGGAEDEVEDLERLDHPDGDHEEEPRPNHGKRDVPEALPCARAVDSCGLERFKRQGLERCG